MPASSSATRARARHVWIYDPDQGLLVDFLDGTEGFVRTNPKDLKQLVHSVDQRTVPQGDPEQYYAAQLLHYGLPPAHGVDNAVHTLKDAFAKLKDGERLNVPQPLTKLKSALKIEYQREVLAQDDRIEQIQKQLDEIEEKKRIEARREAQLRDELEALRPTHTAREVDAVVDEAVGDYLGGEEGLLDEEEDHLDEEEDQLDQEESDTEDVPYRQQSSDRTASPGTEDEVNPNDEDSSSKDDDDEPAQKVVKGNTAEERTPEIASSSGEHVDASPKGVATPRTKATSATSTHAPSIGAVIPKKRALFQDPSPSDTSSSDDEDSSSDPDSTSSDTSSSDDSALDESDIDLPSKKKRQKLGKDTRQQDLENTSNRTTQEILSQQLCGLWDLQTIPNEEAGQISACGWLKIAERHSRNADSTPSGSKALVGKLNLEGLFVAHIIVRLSPIYQSMTREYLWTSFLWSSLREDASSAPLKGKLQILFDGRRLIGTVFGLKKAKPFTFNGIRAEEDPSQPVLLEQDTREWWDNYYKGTYRRAHKKQDNGS